MFKNYFKIAIRNILRNKVFSGINILGLTIGMASSMIILLWIQNEFNYDSFHENEERIYAVWNRVDFNGELKTNDNTPKILGQTMEKDFPEVEYTARVENPNSRLLAAKDKKLSVIGTLVDSNFLQIFTFPLIQGDYKSALVEKHSIIITQSLAAKLFDNEDAMGKTIMVDNKTNFIVSGIIKDPPSNTRFKFEYLLPYIYLKDLGNYDENWGNSSTTTYVLLKPNASLAVLNKKMKKLRPRYDSSESKWEMFLYPMNRWRLYSSFTNGVEDGGGNIQYVGIFGTIAFLTLIIACINFMNLSTARSEKRAKEVGIRKVVGAQRISLIGQFIGESVFLSLIAAIIALVIVFFTIPFFNQIVNEKLIFDLTDLQTLLKSVAFILFAGFLAGSYPAFFLSSFSPVKVLKGTFKKTNSFISIRKLLVIVQFTFAIILIICTIVIKQQIDFGISRLTGYEKNNLVFHDFTGDIRKNYELIKSELLSSGIATSVTKTMSPPTEVWSRGHGQNWEGKDPSDRTVFNRYSQDGNLGKTAGLQFIAGRDLDTKKFTTDSTGMIINEAALRILKFKDPIGKVVQDMAISWHITGVVKDFIINNPFEPVQPIIILGPATSWPFTTLLIKFNSQNLITNNLQKTETIFRKYNPQYPFEYKFVDEEYQRKFEETKTISFLIVVFAALAIFISCLGLFGLAAYMTETRTKEIGLRKVLGASISSVIIQFSKDFLKLVFISFLLATPVAWWMMRGWLNDFYYRVPLSWWVFIFAGILSILIALITVSSNAWRAAMANPIKSLRTE